ncbi:anti-sigma B factor antagonist [Pseudoxanthomonas kalamensis DSM 18571]|uniref:STAS domain-containing protein n=1 Tax=Pseudoxanthomonas kalamensis TaxID=289483 RepID=UPI001FE42AC2|nr:STAS domain-containing protein [Pseudoxanthomonas kalamensis]KAF1712305.1 anti-sigma B factor antagonist [Pseudoxanthomonas kalamensis DSM 18571]
MAATEARLRRDGDALVFSGALDRDAAVSLWPQLAAIGRAERIVLTEVTTVDSAGLALLAELAARLRTSGIAPVIEGAPAGYPELRAAYRLDASLD